MNLAPALIGAFTGPAVMARELETGTFRYAWTQGIGRARWTIAKLGLSLLTWLVLRERYPFALVTSNAAVFSGQHLSSQGGSFPSAAPNNSPWVLSTWNVGRTQWWRYIPDSRFWPMQVFEAGWVLIVAILLGGATVWLVRRRAA